MARARSEGERRLPRVHSVARVSRAVSRSVLSVICLAARMAEAGLPVARARKDSRIWARRSSLLVVAAGGAAGARRTVVSVSAGTGGREDRTGGGVSGCGGSGGVEDKVGSGGCGSGVAVWPSG